MSEYSDRYRQRVSKGTDGSARSIRMKQAKDNYNRRTRNYHAHKAGNQTYCYNSSNLTKIPRVDNSTQFIRNI